MFEYRAVGNEDDDREQGPVLTLVGSYAYSAPKNSSRQFEVGEGLVGQAAQEQRQILIKNVNEDYIKVTSGLGESSPPFICISPLVHEGRVTAVIEIGMFNEPGELALEYLRQSMEAIAITFESVKGRAKLATALQQAQRLSEKLQRQQSEV